MKNLLLKYEIGKSDNSVETTRVQLVRSPLSRVIECLSVVYDSVIRCFTISRGVKRTKKIEITHQ